MLKQSEAMKFEQEAISELSGLLDRVPIVHIEGVRAEPEDSPDRGVDAVIDLRVDKTPYQIYCEFKSNGHPKATRRAIEQLKHLSLGKPSEAVLFAAPYISEPARDLCVAAGVNYFDLHGNFRIFLGSLFMEGRTSDKPAVEKRDLKSLFKPKSARVLRWMLRDPFTPMRLKDIAEGARVSLGQVHNVKEALIDREWADSTSAGVALKDPDSLVDAWREAYEAQPGGSRSYYTLLHGDALVEALKLLTAENRREPVAVLASYSAAAWYAPYGRDETTTLYVWPDAISDLETALSLEPTEKGANVKVRMLEEESVLLDAVEAAPGILATSPIQTYLDLDASGERGREAAAFLRKKGFAWSR